MATSSITSLFTAPRTEATRRPDGTLLLRSGIPLEPHAPTIAHSFRSGSESHPERLLATRPVLGGWASITWREARLAADAIGQALLERGLGPEDPVMILSGNSLEHLMLLLGAYTAGVPVLPVSEAYSTLIDDFSRIREIAEAHSPGLVFAQDADAFGPALDALDDLVPIHVTARRASDRAHTVPLYDLLAVGTGQALEDAFGATGPDTVAKILFTSGSTGAPKGVITTHRMLTANQHAIGQVWPFLHEDPPVLVDWLPWSHAFGGSHNLNLALTFGGTLHVDVGRPTLDRFNATLAALREHQPTVYANVPAGYALLVDALEYDRNLAARFFSRLRVMLYAAAALPDALAERMRALVDEVAGREIPLVSSWGATETAPAATSAHFVSAASANVGVPLPGVTLKLVPADDVYEARVAGPTVTPGYFQAPELTAAAFDAEGFYRTGDAVELIDQDDPDQGLRFAGRLAEDFKLTSGTWVRVTQLRTALLTEAGVLSDVVIAGENHPFAVALAWLAPGHEADAELHERLGRALARVNAQAGAAARIERLVLLAEPPSLQAGETTDKGSVNQRRVLARRAHDVSRALAERPGADVIRPRRG